MSKMYEKPARDIVEKVGGEGNALSVYHCQTRLCFQLKDEQAADQGTFQPIVPALSGAGLVQKSD